jgi:hypothetical protein
MKPADNCPWYQVKVGESFIVPHPNIHTVSNRARRRRDVRGYVYRLKTVDGGVMVKRVA